jgi:hypothetical protein
MATFARIYIWVFLIGLQSVTVLSAILVLKARDTPLKNRLIFSAIMLLEAAVAVCLGLYLLSALQTETLDPLWILLIGGFFAIVVFVVERLAKKHVLKIPQPTLNDFLQDLSQPIFVRKRNKRNMQKAVNHADERDAEAGDNVGIIRDE